MTPTPSATGPTLRLAVITAGTGQPSSTQMLADRVADKARRVAEAHGRALEAHRIDLRDHATEIANAIVSGYAPPRLEETFGLVADADGIVAATPVYKAGYSGLFKAYLDVLDDDIMIAKPVLLAATAGTKRHALVPDEQLRPLFAYLRALTVPTSLFASAEDWGSDSGLADRIERAATELVALMASGVTGRMLDGAWDKYQHTFGSAATRSAKDVDGIDFDTDLMRAATGGSLS